MGGADEAAAGRSGHWETIHTDAAAHEALERSEAARYEAMQKQREAEMIECLQTPEKDPTEVSAQPPGPPESWPVASCPDGEDVCGNGSVLKRVLTPGIAELGKPLSERARVRLKYAAYTLAGKQWDSSEKMHQGVCSIILGDLYVNRVLEAAATSLAWGEKAEFYCTSVYAANNNATTRSPPRSESVLRYEVELLSWRAHGLRDPDAGNRRLTKFDLQAEQRMHEVQRLKAEAAPMVKHGYPAEARALYDEAKYYIDEWQEEGKEGAAEGVGRAGDFVPPAGAKEEAAALRLSLWLNDAMCSLKLGEFRRAAAACTRALALEPICAKAFYRRGVARTHLHDHPEALQDLTAAAKLDPSSRDVREALAALKAARNAAKTRDAKLAQRGLEVEQQQQQQTQTQQHAVVHAEPIELAAGESAPAA